MHLTRFSYCSGAHYEVRTTAFAGSWFEFGNFLSAINATFYVDKAGNTVQQGYICSPQIDGNIRSDLNSQSRDWMAFDQDGYITTDLFERTIDFFSSLDSYIYETRKSRFGAHRFRVIVRCSRPTTSLERLHLAPFITLSSPIPKDWDSKTHGGQQPIYLRPLGNPLIVGKGPPIDVDGMLAAYPIPPTPPVTPMSLRTQNFNGTHCHRHTHFSKFDAIEVFEYLNRGGFIHKAKKNGYELICPFSQDHTSGIHGAIYYPPSALNHFAGGFVCQHHHCSGKNIRHLFDLL